MTDVDDDLRSVMRSFQHQMLERMMISMWLEQIRGLFFVPAKYRGGAVLGAKADWTTALCEGRVEWDRGIIEAKVIERERLVQVLVDVAAEWDIDLREELRYDDD